jgi:protoheme IX farnesyltransferase
VGWLYLGSATALGAGFVWQTWQLRRQPGVEGAMGVFKFSLYYLALVFVAAAVDVLVLG